MILTCNMNHLLNSAIVCKLGGVPYRNSFDAVFAHVTAVFVKGVKQY
jgi:hypothetical protein